MAAHHTIRLKSFELATQDIASVDVASLHALSIGVKWPHRPSDWDMLRSVGHGCVALDEIGRVFSSAMWFPHGTDCATIGMVITSPRVQTHGGGRWMMERILADCGDRRLVLNSTRAAYPLYVSLGFDPQATVFQCQGIVARGLLGVEPRSGTGEAGEVAPLSPADLPDLMALDAAAFGAARPRLLSRIVGISDTVGLRRGGRWVGYAMGRPFGRGHVVGPVVADSDEDAVRLVAPLLAGLEGQFARVDTRQPEGAFRSFLQASGLHLFDTVRTLTRGAPLPKVEPGSPGIYGLAGHALS